MTYQNFKRQLIEAAAAPYRQAGNFAWRFAKGKLGGDPVFFALLQRGLIPDGARLLDIGCGQGLLASFLFSARHLCERGKWPSGWPAAPRPVAIRGIELMPRDVARARDALGEQAEFVRGDMCTTDFRQADVVVILDVLHYVDIAAQNDVLRRVRRALPPGGTLLLRIGDAAAGLPFKISNWVDHTVTFVRGHRLPRLYCRPLREWQSALEALGFAVEPTPMHRGTPFANILLVCRVPAAG